MRCNLLAYIAKKAVKLYAAVHQWDGRRRSAVVSEEKVAMRTSFLLENARGREEDNRRDSDAHPISRTIFTPEGIESNE